MKKSKKETALKRRWIAFKTWLIENETTQSELALQLGISVSTISMMIERGKFTDGVFADWWKENIEKANDANAGCYPAQQTKNEVVA